MAKMTMRVVIPRWRVLVAQAWLAGIIIAGRFVALDVDRSIERMARFMVRGAVFRA